MEKGVKPVVPGGIFLNFCELPLVVKQRHLGQVTLCVVPFLADSFSMFKKSVQSI